MLTISMYPAERGEEENEVTAFPFKDTNTEILHTSFLPDLVTFAILAARNVGKYGFSLGPFVQLKFNRFCLI